MKAVRFRVHNGHGGIKETQIVNLTEAVKKKMSDMESVRRIIAIFDFSAKVNETLSEMDGRFSTEDFFIYFDEALCSKRIRLGNISYADTIEYSPERYAEKVITDFIEHGKGQHQRIEFETAPEAAGEYIKG